MSGSWSSEQQGNSDDNASVQPDSTLVRKEAATPPADPTPRLPTPTGPPPAWLETDRGSFWLGHSTFCWKEHVPRIAVSRGELVTAHLGFERRELTLTSFPAGKPERITTGGDPVWRVEREGAFSLFAIAKEGGDASYVACFEVDE